MPQGSRRRNPRTDTPAGQTSAARALHPDRALPNHGGLPRISLRCTDLPPVPAARQLGLAADSDRPQAGTAKARSGPERVLPSYSPNGPVLAVSNLDLEVRLGDVYGFLGPNGAGKTTTLRMLAGLVRPTSGSALIGGYSPGSSGSLRKVGCLIESPAYYPGSRNKFVSGSDL